MNFFFFASTINYYKKNLLFVCNFYLIFQIQIHERYNIMSKSVRSYASSRAKDSQESSQNIKEKIKDILYSIKQERQHIENRLYQNDVEINKLRKDYELLRYQHDFQHLNEEQLVFVEELRDGLKENSINPQVIMGGIRQQGSNYRDLSKEQVIEVQKVLIRQLQQLMKQ